MIAPTSVLVVDDSLTVRNIIVKSLRSLGFVDVDEAEDGNVALERIRQKQYGLLITDWEMPNMSGEEFLKIVRHDPKCMKMPIIMITGTTTRGTSWLAAPMPICRSRSTMPISRRRSNRP
jgi:two-component system, chemotaxis family, chemotaxis protein CheY